MKNKIIELSLFVIFLSLTFFSNVVTEELRNARPKEPSSPSFWNLLPKDSILSSILRANPIKPPIISAKRTPRVLFALPAIPSPKTSVTRPEDVITIVRKEEGNFFLRRRPRIVPNTTETAFINVTSIEKSYNFSFHKNNKN